MVRILAGVRGGEYRGMLTGQFLGQRRPFRLAREDLQLGVRRSGQQEDG